MGKQVETGGVEIGNGGGRPERYPLLVMRLLSDSKFRISGTISI